MELSVNQLKELISKEEDFSRKIELVEQLKARIGKDNPPKKTIKKSNVSKTASVKIGKHQEKSVSVGSKERILPPQEVHLLVAWRDIRVALDLSKQCGFYDEQKELIEKNHPQGMFLIDIYEQNIPGMADKLIRQYSLQMKWE